MGNPSPSGDKSTEYYWQEIPIGRENPSAHHFREVSNVGPSKGKLLIALICLIFFVPSTIVQADADLDPWYEDMEDHWSYHYVHTLWQEEVTDGEICHGLRWILGHFRFWTWSCFYPEENTTRAAFAVLLAKVFSLPLPSDNGTGFNDVGKDYCLYGKKVAKYLEAARIAGFIEPDAAGKFYPDHPLDRKDAVVILLHALELEAYAFSLDEEQIDIQLRGFRDANDIPASYRPYLATAVMLGINEGYPDRTIKPNRTMSRAEAATIVYRSCLIRVMATPNPFSPDGDGHEDVTYFTLSPLKNCNVSRWQVDVFDCDEDEVWSKSGNTRTQQYPPPAVPWPGCTEDGEICPPGLYYYRASVEDRANQTFYSALKPLIITGLDLSAHLAPAIVAPGSSVEVFAHTLGPAATVDATISWLSLSLIPDTPLPATENDWTGQLQVPLATADGEYSVEVVGHFPTMTKSVTLILQVHDPLPLQAQIHPNPTAPGGEVVMTAWSGETAAQMQAHLCGRTIDLLNKGSYWQGTAGIPTDWPLGETTVNIKVTSLAGKEKTVTLPLVVEQPQITGPSRLIFSLTD
jgi:hypothetical protein